MEIIILYVTCCAMCIEKVILCVLFYFSIPFLIPFHLTWLFMCNEPHGKNYSKNDHFRTNMSC